MKVIDLTHTIEENMPVFPGTKPPSLKAANTHERDGFKETLLTMFSHTGTHIDPPAHIFKDGKTLDSFDASTFVGTGLVIDCRHLENDAQIPLELLTSNEYVKEADFLLFNLGWDKKWGSAEYFYNYPCLSDKALEFIISGSYKGIGFDSISLDPIDSLARHKRLFASKEIINVENLKNLGECGKKPFTFVCLPMKIKDSDGAPTRAIAIIEE